MTDTAFVFVLEAAIADAAGPYEVCGTDPVTLNATTNGTGEWTGGAGIFADNADPGTTYTPAASELGTTVTLTWNTFDPDGAGPSLGLRPADLTISIPATAIAEARTVCAATVPRISV
ncbi:MAG: hypothetical protein IPP26_01510 [Flavobacteriales bacterium]|nr:hypothetical protein [Flavobacteriales bacterium]